MAEKVKRIYSKEDHKFPEDFIKDNSNSTAVKKSKANPSNHQYYVLSKVSYKVMHIVKAHNAEEAEEIAFDDITDQIRFKIKGIVESIESTTYGIDDPEHLNIDEE